MVKGFKVTGTRDAIGIKTMACGLYTIVVWFLSKNNIGWKFLRALYLIR